MLPTPLLGLILSSPPPPAVAADAEFNVSTVTGVVYGQGLIFAGTPNQRVVNLTLDAYIPSQRDGGQPVPLGARPAVMFVHGGGFMGSILDPDKAASVVPDVDYFVRRGFVGFQLNYRLGSDNGSAPTTWPSFAPTGGAGLGLQPAIPAGASLFESQRFALGADHLLTLASDGELCASAAPGGSVSMQPCRPGGASSNGANGTIHWRVAGESIVAVGGVLDGRCLGTKAPQADKRAFVAFVAPRCSSSDPSQRWQATGLGNAGGGTICRPTSPGAAPGAGPVDAGCLSFAGGFNPPVSHLYPAVRDAKAAVRWRRAEWRRA